MAQSATARSRAAEAGHTAATTRRRRRRRGTAGVIESRSGETAPEMVRR